MSTITVQGADNSVIISSLTLLTAQLEAARKALEKLNLDPLKVSAMAEQAAAILKASQGNVGRETWTLSGELGPTMRVGVSLLIEKLNKIRQGQMELGIMEPDDTEERLAQARSFGARLVDRAPNFIDALADGIEGVESVTLSSGGRSVKVSRK